MENKKTSNEHKPQTNNPSQKPSSWTRNLLIAFLLIGLAVVLFFMFNNSTGTYVPYNQFKKELSSGNVKSVTFNATTIDFEYKDNTEGWFYTRSSVEEKVLSDIEAFDPSSEIVLVYFNKTTSFSIVSLLYPILLVGALAFLTLFVIRQIGKSNNKSFDFVKNRARITKTNIKFENVAGIDEEKDEVKEIVEFLKNPKKFMDMGARIPKGVILIGAPGTGKTLLAKAIAGEADVPFFTISGSDFMELFVGVGASRVRDLFETAKKASPCIIFIDEIDAIGRQRGTGLGGGNDEREQTLNQLLVQMDGFETNEGIIVIAATNRADILDPALMRPGRFDRQIIVHLPDVKGREEILKVHAKNKKLAKDTNFKQIARITSGFTGADLENLLNEAAILAARENKTEISMLEITEGINKVTMGPQKKSLIVTERDRKITAIHEAGHAIISKFVTNSDPVHEVSIIPRGMAAGYTVSRPDNDDNHVTRQKLIDMITLLLGGRVAERLFLNDISTGASNDIMHATSIARKMVVEYGMGKDIGLMHLGSENSYFFGKDYVERTTYSESSATMIDREIQSILQLAESLASEILTKQKKKLLTMVEVLLERNTIYTDEVDMIIAGKTAKAVISFIDKKLGERTPSPSEEKSQKVSKPTQSQPKTKTKPSNNKISSSEKPQKKTSAKKAEK